MAVSLVQLCNSIQKSSKWVKKATVCESHGESIAYSPAELEGQLVAHHKLHNWSYNALRDKAAHIPQSGTVGGWGGCRFEPASF